MRNRNLHPAVRARVCPCSGHLPTDCSVSGSKQICIAPTHTQAPLHRATKRYKRQVLSAYVRAIRRWMVSKWEELVLESGRLCARNSRYNILWILELALIGRNSCNLNDLCYTVFYSTTSFLYKALRLQKAIKPGFFCPTFFHLRRFGRRPKKGRDFEHPHHVLVPAVPPNAECAKPR